VNEKLKTSFVLNATIAPSRKIAGAVCPRAAQVFIRFGRARSAPVAAGVGGKRNALLAASLPSMSFGIVSDRARVRAQIEELIRRLLLEYSRDFMYADFRICASTWLVFLLTVCFRPTWVKEF
jgi:hypothetical protein